MIYPLRSKTPKIHSSALLTPSSEIIGDVEIQEGASIWFQTVLRGDVNKITIGKNTNVQDGTVVHGTYQKYEVKVGEGCTIGHSVTLHACTIDDFCLVGMGATILDGAIIGKESIVGAGTLVTKEMRVPPRSLVLGSPGKRVRSLSDEEVQGIYVSMDRYKLIMTWYDESYFKKGGNE